MFVCKAYLWNKESLMVYNLESKRIKILFIQMPFAMIPFLYDLCRTGLHVLRSTATKQFLRRINPPPPASDFRICAKLRIFAVPVFRNFAVPVFRCSWFN